MEWCKTKANCTKYFQIILTLEGKKFLMDHIYCRYCQSTVSANMFTTTWSAHWLSVGQNVAIHCWYWTVVNWVLVVCQLMYVSRCVSVECRSSNGRQITNSWQILHQHYANTRPIPTITQPTVIHYIGQLAVYPMSVNQQTNDISTV